MAGDSFIYLLRRIYVAMKTAGQTDEFQKFAREFIDKDSKTLKEVVDIMRKYVNLIDTDGIM